MRYKDLREEELKKHVAGDYFGMYDTVPLLGNIDFAVKQKPNPDLIKSKQGTVQESIDTNEFFLWAEAKTKPCEPIEMMAQLILTIGKARTFENLLPPSYLGCFDYMKIAFVPYYEVQEIFFLNDFNWNVTSSNSGTKEFRLIYEKLESLIDRKLMIFDFEKDETELKKFIKDNFVFGKISTSKIQITKNNFISVYNKWLTEVKPSIHLSFTWDEARNQGYLDADFYLADLMSEGNKTLGDKLFVLLKESMYKFDKEVKIDGRVTFSEVYFKDDQKAHNLFWIKYERPPREEYREFILNRRDLLVPQDIRERKGSFYTPQIWVELSQKYLADVFGENWQEEYFIWDCAAGTGNLLIGLTDKYRIYASTLDKADVAVMHERIEKGANLLKDHVFQFDFLNDDINNLPEGLLKIAKTTPEKLIIYINPPYAEADSRIGTKRRGVAVSKAHKKYSDTMGYSKREIYIQFLTLVYKEFQGVKLANFSKLKHLQAPRFINLRNFFHAKLHKLFIVPAETFDNVDGDFPIGFQIWDTKIHEPFSMIDADVYNHSGNFICKKCLSSFDNAKLINDWVKSFRKIESKSIATIIGVASDFQNQRLVRFGPPYMKVPADNHNWQISEENLLKSCIYFTIRKIIPATWINDRDQFLYPNDNWKKDKLFQTNCLTYTLFHNSNNIQSQHCPNHWIPFTESEVNARTRFESNFMTDFIKGKIKNETNGVLSFEDKPVTKKSSQLTFSQRATEVFNAGRELWKYYHAQSNCNVNASFYDIRAHFQGREESGKMKSTSEDEKYNKLLSDLKLAMKFLAQEIEPKVYEYGFLKD